MIERVQLQKGTGRVRHLLQDQRGMSLVELAVAIVVLTILSYSLMAAIDAYTSQIHHTRTVQSRDKQMAALLDNLRSNIDLYQVSYNHAETDADAFLNPDSLPLAWDATTIRAAADCGECPGRLGYVAHPVTGMPGVFRVLVRVVNPSLFEGFRDYEFLVTP